MSKFVVASLFPALLNIHGDAENAEVLAVRARWRGVDAAVKTISSPREAAGPAPDAVVIGSGFDADAPEVLEGLRGMRDELHAWTSAGVPLFAVGLGWDLLSASVELGPDWRLPGLGVFAGRSVRSSRRVGTVAVSSEWGTLVGYEYHLRDYEPADGERPIGTILRGTGNISGAGHGGPEGAVSGASYGTGLRGPVLARNPRLADHLLGLAPHAREQHAGDADAAERIRVTADVHADRANRIVLQKLGLEPSGRTQKA